VDPRKSVWKVDGSILALGIFYLIVGAVFLFFENVVINYRPVLIEGVLEASYPSSTTMLVLCVMGSAGFQFRQRIQNPVLRWCVILAVSAFTVLMVAGRLLSGVHWLTDIIGGGLLSGGLLILYDAAAKEWQIYN
jgi:undecaprenyl-diphosphatase